jgi:RNA polymerase sigma-70 factor, ECF subfamily
MEIVRSNKLADRYKEDTDEEIVQKVLAGEKSLFETLMRRHNQRLYRVARSILRNDNEAEDLIQDTYVRAYSHLDQFSGRSKFSTWLTKIAFYEALARKRKSYRFVSMNHGEEGDQDMERFASSVKDPENNLIKLQMKEILESAVDSLPEKYRIVFILREIEEMSTEETSDCLGIGIETVKSRLFRARAMLRQEIDARTAGVTRSLFQFGAERCDRVVSKVLKQIEGIEV